MQKIAFVLAAALAAAPLSAQQPKNVQILTDLTPTQLQRTMNMMRGSLGTHCDYCHVVTEKDGWNFASDDKPEKKTARDMITMTMELNQKFHSFAMKGTRENAQGKTAPIEATQGPGSAARILTSNPEGETENILDRQGGGTTRCRSW